MTTRMIFMRHGDTGYRWGIFVGSTDVDLARGGLEKAGELGERLKPEGVRAIYTSQLQRAWKTAGAIGKVLGIRPVRLKELNEVDFGKWEIRSHEDVEKEHGNLLNTRRRDIWNFRGHGGESYGQARDRAIPVIRDLFRRHEGETFAVVAHGSLMKIVCSTLTGLPLEEIAKKECKPLSAMFFKKDGSKIVLEKEWGVGNGKL
jgi:broad specificity phosphatase PhoE